MCAQPSTRPRQWVGRFDDLVLAAPGAFERTHLETGTPRHWASVIVRPRRCSTRSAANFSSGRILAWTTTLRVVRDMAAV
jgi:hypothetical protein